MFSRTVDVMVLFRQRIPNIRESVERLIPEVRRRNQYALLQTGGESVLLYMPDSVVDDADWDDVRQTYSIKDKTYKLYLNRTLDRQGNRVYTNDTDLVPSMLVAFPANPDSESHREEGLVLSVRTAAWTLWDPILPVRGGLLHRYTTSHEWWLIENVTYSYFPTKTKDGVYLLHQEMQISGLTDDSGIDVNSLPTVEDTLSIYTNKFDGNIGNVEYSGNITPNFDTGADTSGNVSIACDAVTISQHTTSIQLYRASGSGRVGFTYGVWSDTSRPSCYIDPSLSQVGIKLNPTTTLITCLYDFQPQTWCTIKTKMENYVLSVYIDNKKVLSYDLKRVSDFSDLLPYVGDVFTIDISSGEYTLKNLYIMENI